MSRHIKEIPARSKLLLNKEVKKSKTPNVPDEGRQALILPSFPFRKEELYMFTLHLLYPILIKLTDSHLFPKSTMSFSVVVKLHKGLEITGYP